MPSQISVRRFGMRVQVVTRFSNEILRTVPGRIMWNRAIHFTNACLLMQIKASNPIGHNLTLGIRLGQPNNGMN
jgi:hypothetical protein